MREEYVLAEVKKELVKRFKKDSYESFRAAEILALIAEKEVEAVIGIDEEPEAAQETEEAN